MKGENASMTLLKRKSSRTDKEGKPYEDLFLCWHEEGKFKYIQIRTAFVSETKHLKRVAVLVPKGEELEKYCG